MKVYGLGIGFLLASLAAASAQVTAEVLLEQEQYVAGEPWKAQVRIINRSGRTLDIGATADWLTFSIETGDGQAIPQAPGAPLDVIDQLAVPSSKAAITKRIDLTYAFSLQHPAPYTIRAIVRVPGLETPVVSAPKVFEVVEGTKLWEQEIGLPPAAGATNAPPETRKYVLKRAGYIGGQVRLYVAVLDASGRTLRALPIGPALSFGNRELQVDAASHLHFLYQGGAQTFTHFVFDTDGSLLQRQTFEMADSRPHLATDRSGIITVAGGARVFKPTDIPTPLFPPPLPAMGASNPPAPHAPAPGSRR